MILYHGSSLEVAKPDLRHSRSNVDFGRGFYVTPLYEQAVKWCGKFKRRGKDGVISCYEYDESRENELKILKFESYNEEWLDFILNCRTGKIQQIMTLLWAVLLMIRYLIRWSFFLMD